MRFRLWFETGCPLKTCMYGGIPDVGGYQCNTEYEIGAQFIAEAAHCILGSLGKGDMSRPLGHDYDAERGHIEEELGIILKSIKEYGQSFYSERLVYRQDKYSDASVESIRSNSPKLKEKARSLKQRLRVTDNRRAIAEACYDLIVVLADEMVDSVKDYPREVTNAFTSDLLIRAAQHLQRTVLKVYPQ